MSSLAVIGYAAFYTALTQAAAFSIVMYWLVTVSHPRVKMSSLNPCIVLGHIIKSCLYGK